jgi:hypothetical protein
MAVPSLPGALVSADQGMRLPRHAETAIGMVVSGFKRLVPKPGFEPGHPCGR